MDREYEQALVFRFQAGEEDAFLKLYEHYAGPLKYYVRRLLDREAAADDVLQSVWMKVVRGIGTLQRLDLFRTWLYRIARNEVVQSLRRKRKWTEMDSDVAASDPQEEPDDAFHGIDANALHAALLTLKRPHREVLVLKFLEDMSYKEIASLIERDLGTVRSRLHYAKKALRRVLEGDSHDHEQ